MKEEKTDYKEQVNEMIDKVLEGEDPRKVLEAIKTFKEYKPKLEHAVKKHFPKSDVKVSIDNDGLVTIEFTVAGSKSELVGGKWENDISPITITIGGFNMEGELDSFGRVDPPKLRGGSILVKSKDGKGTERRMLDKVNLKPAARDRYGIPIDRAVSRIQAMFGNLKKGIKANQADIPDEQKKLLKSMRLK